MKTLSNGNKNANSITKTDSQKTYLEVRTGDGVVLSRVGLQHRRVHQRVG